METAERPGADALSLRATIVAHRTEILLAVALMIIVAVSAAVAWAHLVAAAPADACWEAVGRDRACARAMGVFGDLEHEEAQKVVGLAAFVPFAVGLLVGVPIAAGSDRPPRGERRPVRWLVRRSAPLAAIALVGLAIIATLIAAMTAVGAPAGSIHRPAQLDSLTVEPLSFVARGLMAFGLGLLAGAILRRPLAAYVLSTAVLVVILGLTGPGVHRVVAEGVAVWDAEVCSPIEDEGCDFPASLYVLDHGYRDPSGTILSESAVEAAWERCPDGSARCSANLGQLTLIQRSAPPEAYSTFAAAEAVTWTAIGIACILAAFAVVRRRRAG